MANITKERRNQLALELVGLFPECIGEKHLSPERRRQIDQRLDEIGVELDGYDDDDTKDETK